ncbi:hypothetical protein C2845_PM09G12010 [Panicum miliaceum]|uniref:Uncharacterized protein n=1 Tax=Panicum miliaceum TaxID=4540 RepID=A0A3L6S1N6_PANMI|nr:hypothetical protein C2845_PM09G12010 [Panicum miliaceum]
MSCASLVTVHASMALYHDIDKYLPIGAQAHAINREEALLLNYANEESLALRFSGELKKGGTRMFILMNLEMTMALRLEMCSLLN